MSSFKNENVLFNLEYQIDSQSTLPIVKFNSDSFSSNSSLSYPGVGIHFSNLEDFYNLSVSKELNEYIAKNKVCFAVFLYGDIKNFVFKYVFVDKLVSHKVQYSNMTVAQSVTSAETINSNEINITVLDYCGNSNSIPSFLPNLLTASTSKLTLIKNLTESVTFDVKVKCDYSLPFDAGKLKSLICEVSLRSELDDAQLIQESCDLNIKLMKWRMFPELKNEDIQGASFLLIGAGTLGCNVARNLMGWGARKITFVDNGRVSASNPARQSLYTSKDGIEKPYKATRAAEIINEILPFMQASGEVLSIPLPGRNSHAEGAFDAFVENANKLEKLISESDVVFLLTDSRESRWFPTVLCKFYRKTCLTVALGFNNFVVIRHGDFYPFKEVVKDLGCYFCNDVVIPSDSSMSRTLDQQCTISRVGLSGISSGYAVEMAINLIQGIEETPHTLRGDVFGFKNLILENRTNTLWSFK